MQCVILITGGKDSSLAALMLSQYFDVRAANCNFGILESWHSAESVAKKLRLRFNVVKLDMEVMEKAAEQMIKDGFPRNGLNVIHLHALSKVAENGAKMIADGTRRDDRAPLLSLSDIMSFEMKNNVQYVRPLAGFGRRTLDLLVEKFLVIEESEGTRSSDYELEIRKFMEGKYGEEKVKEVFPKHHEHSRVVDVKREKVFGNLKKRKKSLYPFFSFL